MQNKAIAKGLFWTFTERFSAQLVTAIVSIILARLLSPESYGTISIVLVFISFCEIFVTSSFGKAVVQKEQPDASDYDTALSLGLFFSVCVCGLCMVVAPLVADFFEIPILTNLIRVMAIRIPIGAFYNIQQAYIQKNMLFRKLFVVTLASSVFSGVLGIVMACNGYGIWSLVGQYLSSSILSAIVLFFYSGWRPGWKFSLQRAKQLFSFGWKLMMGDLIDNGQREIRSVLIGKVFGTADLAYYDQGNKYPKLFINTLTSALGNVMLPAYAKYQNDQKTLVSMLRSAIQTGVFVIAPIMIGFAAIADNFVMAFLSEKWMASVPYLVIFCFSYITRPLETFCCQAIIAKGKSRAILIASTIINLSSLLFVLVATFVLRSVFFIALSNIAVMIVSVGCYLWYSNKILDYKTKDQIKDVIPSLWIAVAMGILVYFVGRLPMKVWPLLFLQIASGVLIYGVLAILTKNDVAIKMLHSIRLRCLRNKGK